MVKNGFFPKQIIRNDYLLKTVKSNHFLDLPIENNQNQYVGPISL